LFVGGFGNIICWGLVIPKLDIGHESPPPKERIDVVTIHKGGKLFGKLDEFNTDREEDEEDYIWEIERDWSAKYYRRNRKKLNNKRVVIIQQICNHRKHVDFEGELLIMWTDGTREWSYISASYHDSKDNRESKYMVMEYMEQMKFTTTIMSFGINYYNPITKKECPTSGKKLLETYLKNMKQMQTANIKLGKKTKLNKITTRKKIISPSKRTTKYNKSWSNYKGRTTRSQFGRNLKEAIDASDDETIIDPTEEQNNFGDLKETMKKLPNQLEPNPTPTCDEEKSPNDFEKKLPNLEVESPLCLEEEKLPNQSLVDTNVKLKKKKKKKTSTIRTISIN
jgi:hypothetical protein